MNNPKIKLIISLTTAPERTIYLEINLTKKVQDLYTKSHKNIIKIN